MSALTTWLTAIADAIRGKDGTALPIDHADFPAKITAIPQLDTSDATATESDILLGKTAYAGGVELTGTNTNNADTTSADIVANDLLYDKKGYGAAGTEITGTGAYWQYVSVFFPDNSASGNWNLYIPNVTSLANTFMRKYNLTSITLYITNKLTNLSACFRNDGGTPLLTTVTFYGSTENVTDVSYMFLSAGSVVNILGDPLNFSSVTVSTIWLNSAAKLTTINFVPSSIKINFSFEWCPLLSTASLLSIANGLEAASEPKTLTMHATSKTNMNNITVDNVDGVAVPGNAMTLMEFITDIKEWTVA